LTIDQARYYDALRSFIARAAGGTHAAAGTSYAAALRNDSISNFFICGIDGPIAGTALAVAVSFHGGEKNRGAEAPRRVVRTSKSALP
jgi:hypothetical protein